MADKVALVVGAGPGLGAALARRFAAGGYAVAVARRKAADLEDLAAEVGGKAYGCDAADAENVAALLERIGKDLGTPTLVAYNAGAYSPGSILEIAPAEFERCWRIGCLGGFNVGQQAARGMLKEGGGTILFTGATAALRGGKGFVNLAVGKFGLRALAQSMARELGPENIHVAHLIIDGQIAGDRTTHSESARGENHVLKPEAIAETAWFLHEQQKSAWTQELDLRPYVENW